MAFHSIEGAVVAVTGGGGFIGRRLVERLAERQPARLIVLDRRAQDASSHSATLTTRQVTLGAAGPDELDAALDSVTHLFHLAAAKHAGTESDAALLATNVTGTHALFEAARRLRVKKIVFASSLYAYGRDRGAPLSEEETPHPTTVYGISKLAGEQLGLCVASGGGPAFVALRYFFAYGPGQLARGERPAFIPATLARLARGEPPVIRGDGTQVLDYVYVDDVVEATIRAMESDLSGETLNVGSGVALPVGELASRMQTVAGTGLPVLHEASDDTAGTRRVASTERAQRLLGFRAAVSLDEGLSRTWRTLTASGSQ